jgi:TolB-like protein/Tfp pilus assembly protein PilF
MATDLIGRVVARYRVLELIGVGGMGAVYKAEDSRLRRLVALKFVSTALAQDPVALRQFEREAQAASSLSHANICTIYGIDTWEGQPFIAMELLSGETLKERLAHSRLDAASLVDLAIQITDALAAAHDQDIIHRDVKPANIFITREGPAKLLDFGLAKRIPVAGPDMAQSSGFTAVGRILGTANYMSPERLRGRDADQRSDLFSLGAVLYEAVAGCRAFTGESVVEIIDAILHREPPPLDERSGRQPIALIQIIARLLEKAPEDRYHSAAALTTALVTLREDLATGRASVAVGGHDWPLARASIAILPFRNLDRDADHEFFGDGLAAELISALDKISGLKVAARESAFTFKRRNAELREIGTRLRVETVLDGTVRRSGDKIRVVCRLTKVSDGFQVWSERYEFDKSAMGEIFAVQDRITRSLVDKLMLTRIAELRPLQHYTEDRESYFEYWRGRFYWAQRYEGGLDKAMFHFNAAIERDDRNARAYSGQADVILFRGLYSLRRPRLAFDDAAIAAAQALKVDERLPEVHTTMGLLALARWKWRLAEAEFTRATELDKKQALAYIYYSWLLAMRRRHGEAVQAVNRAQFADPLAPLVNSGAAFTYFLMQQYDQAINECKKCREFEPDFLVGLYVMAMALTREGKYDEALPLISRAAELSRRAAFYVGLLGQIYAETGRLAEVEKLLEELRTRSATEYVPPHSFAYIYASCGDKDQAFKWQERACEDGAPPFYFMSPAIDSLFDDARHQAQMERMESAAGKADDDAVRLSRSHR